MYTDLMVGLSFMGGGILAIILFGHLIDKTKIGNELNGLALGLSGGIVGILLLNLIMG